MQFPQLTDRGLIGLASQHHHHIDVAAGRAEVTGDQRSIDIDANQIRPLHQPVPQTLEQEDHVTWKLSGSVLRGHSSP